MRWLKKIAGGILVAAPFMFIAATEVVDHGWGAALIMLGVIGIVVTTMGAGIFLLLDS